MKKLALIVMLCIAPMVVGAKIVSERVAYEHAGEKLEGYLTYDDAQTGKRPGALVVHEWWGLNEYAEHRARQLAEAGYVAFALDMYGVGRKTRTASQARKWAGKFYGSPLMAERAQAGLDQLLATGLVDDQRVAAMGFCFGGTTVMELAYSGASLAGIVSFHGGPVPAMAEGAKMNQAKFLICHGAIDPMVPKEKLDGFLRSLDARDIDYQFIAYAGALHAFTNKEADELAEQNKLKGVGYDEDAARRAWGHAEMFLKEVFEQTK